MALTRASLILRFECLWCCWECWCVAEMVGSWEWVRLASQLLTTLATDWSWSTATSAWRVCRWKVTGRAEHSEEIRRDRQNNCISVGTGWLWLSSWPLYTTANRWWLDGAKKWDWAETTGDYSSAAVVSQDDIWSRQVRLNSHCHADVRIWFPFCRNQTQTNCTTTGGSCSWIPIPPSKTPARSQVAVELSWPP